MLFKIWHGISLKIRHFHPFHHRIQLQRTQTTNNIHSEGRFQHLCPCHQCARSSFFQTKHHAVEETWRKITTFTFSTQPSLKECEIWIQSDFICLFINLPRVVCVCVERVVRVEVPSASDPKITFLYYFMNAMVGNSKFFYAGYLMTTNKATCIVSWFYRNSISLLRNWKLYSI